MNKNYFIILFYTLLIISCQSKPDQKLKTGDWLFHLPIGEKNGLTIPFNVEVISENQLIIKNDEEKIEVNDIVYRNDSVFIKMPVFGSEFKGKISKDKISGEYINYNRNKITPVPFTAEAGVKERFRAEKNADVDFSGKWEVDFISGEKSSPAIGIFKQNGNYVSGTFETNTGDYRYLQGIVTGNKMLLSCFDGAHAFLFTAAKDGDNLDGMFYSGNTWQQKWTAKKSDDAELDDMKSLTFLKQGFEKLSFRFPNANGDTISMDDEKYKDKVVIVQIFGTWCPNCMDETRYFVQLYKNYKEKGLEIIGLDFEIKPDMDYFKKRVTKFREDLNIPYELVLAGPASKKQAAEALPMLNKVVSFPTAIFIDKTGKVREIHTGFSGPGTGEAYEVYKKETEELIERLINE